MTEMKKYNLGAISKTKAINHIVDHVKECISFELLFIDYKTAIFHKVTHEFEKQEQRIDADGSVWQRVK